MNPRALIAEDEPLLARALQQALAQAWPELQIAATVGDGLSAASKAHSLAMPFIARPPRLLIFAAAESASLPARTLPPARCWRR